MSETSKAFRFGLLVVPHFGLPTLTETRPLTSMPRSGLEELSPIVLEIAKERGWSEDWLSNKAVMFVPAWGRAVQWQPLLDDENVSISIAPLDALLAMKLNAARPGRDTDDIVKLLALNGIASVSEAADLFESFYPGDVLPDRTIRLLERILELGPPKKPPAPQSPNLGGS